MCKPMSDNAFHTTGGTRYHTLDVLAGAYKHFDSAKSLLTHLAYLDTDGFPERVGCRVKVEHLVDHLAHSEDQLLARPTCPRCASKWDKLQAQR